MARGLMSGDAVERLLRAAAVFLATHAAHVVKGQNTWREMSGCRRIRLRFAVSSALLAL